MGVHLNILFVGDIYGKPGRRAAADLIPRLREIHRIDFCIANGENAAGGFGITENIAKKLFAYGADVVTTGNHVWDRKDAIPYIFGSNRVLRPANFPERVGGAGYGVFNASNGATIGVVCMQGRVNMLDLDCPFRVGRDIVDRLRQQTQVIVVDFHAEASSEKIAYGWFMDGRASAVLGTHTHVQTADERILPGGTAYVSDAGMTGPHDSVIGARKEAVIKRFLDRMPVRFEPAEDDIKLCGVVVEVNDETGRATRIERLRVDWLEA